MSSGSIVSSTVSTKVEKGEIFGHFLSFLVDLAKINKISRANGYALAIDVHRHIVKSLGTHECLWKLSHDRALALRIDSRSQNSTENEPSTSREIKEENAAEDDGISDISDAEMSQTESEMHQGTNVPISMGILPIELAGEYEGPTAGLEFTSRPSISLAPLVEMPSTSKNSRPDRSKQRNVLSLQQKIKIIRIYSKKLYFLN